MMFLLDMIVGLFTGNKQSSFSPEALVDQFFIRACPHLPTFIHMREHAINTPKNFS